MGSLAKNKNPDALHKAVLAFQFLHKAVQNQIAHQAPHR